MSFERDAFSAVQMMFKHAKALISKNLTNAVTKGELTIDKTKLPGLELLISKSIDDAFMQSGRQLGDVLKNHLKK